jgi:hypothetical protein
MAVSGWSAKGEKCWFVMEANFTGGTPMIVDLEQVADRGCWISDDRVYVFFSSAGNSIAEVGYHGAQPASRNARVFHGSEGVCTFAVADPAGVRHTLVFTDFNWSPGALWMLGKCGIGSVQVRIHMCGRDIRVIPADASRDIAAFQVDLKKSAYCNDVHGHRTWEDLPVERAGYMRLGVRDQVILNEWMKRDGPYGPDFLIPEPVRRKIFRSNIRSGFATPRDLLPEFPDSTMPIYDAEIRIDIGGEGYSIRDTGEAILFSAPVCRETGKGSPFEICFDVRDRIQMQTSTDGKSPSRQSDPGLGSAATVPELTLPGFAHIERFFSSVPGLVDSCIIREYGIPRATPGGYYWIWAWDAMVTALASLRWGGVEIAGRTAVFVDGHRDEERIPMRWTHALEALDAQAPGALETLLASLNYSLMREKQDSALPAGVYSRMVRHLNLVADHSDRRGLFTNIGFYPDLPLRFGRTEGSAVAMEIAAFYAFCSVCENSAHHMGDQATAQKAREMKAILERSFCEVFWDKSRKFFVDAIDRKTGLRNQSYPLFTLLFLHFPPAIRLIEKYLAESADFMARHHLTPLGLRMLPLWDNNAASETVSGSWYPHWDAYALKVFRKAGHASEIMTWLGSVEGALAKLGYAPEFLTLAPKLANNPELWLRHGAASNLNCVTGWYQALLEGVVGLEFDPGGLTIMPLSLPLDQAAVRGVWHLGTRWNVNTRRGGSMIEELRIDGEKLSGCLKVPIRCHDRGEHAIEVRYGDVEPLPHIIKLSNAEILDLESSPRGIEVEVNALGQVDLEFFAPVHWTLFVDGTNFGAHKFEMGGLCSAALPIAGKHTITISRPS